MSCGFGVGALALGIGSISAFVIEAQPICDMAAAMEPIVMGVSWLIAMMIVGGVRGGGSS